MSGRPLVSICIPTYNGEKFLEECLDACIHQTFANYEIVVCDDGSTDSSLEIIKKYAAQHPRIRYFVNEKNLGLVGNWNKCIKKSEGEWIKFVFQDDYITRDCLEKFVARIGDQVSLMVSERNFLLPAGLSPDKQAYYAGGVRTLRNTTAFRGEEFSAQMISSLAVENLALNFIGEPSLIFFRRDLVSVHGYFSDALQQICDLEFVLRIGTRYGLLYIPEKLCLFRVHEQSTTSANIRNKYFELRFMEPLLFAWFLLYGEEYDRFRSHLSTFQFLKLKTYFRLKAYQARQASIKEGRQHVLFSGTGTEFKEIMTAGQGNLLIKLISILKK
jgi:glycosyltransferase involved in cell wall biosynthesis